MTEIEKKDLKDLKGMISAGTRFLHVEVSSKNTTNGTEYVALFVTEGAKFGLYTQMRSDRAWELRKFCSIDTAVKNIKKTGFRGVVAIFLD